MYMDARARERRESLTEGMTMSKRTPTANVDFTQATSDPHPEQVLYALAGVCTALAELQPRLGDRHDFDVQGNLATAARILSRHLIERLT